MGNPELRGMNLSQTIIPVSAGLNACLSVQTYLKDLIDVGDMKIRNMNPYVVLEKSPPTEGGVLTLAQPSRGHRRNFED